MEEEKKPKNGKRVWINEEGIICFSLGESPTEEEIFSALDEGEEVLRSFKGEKKILVYTSPYLGPILSRMEIRERLTEEAGKIMGSFGDMRIAIFGGDAVSRTITSFIIRVSGAKNVEVFSDEDKALAWLKE